MTLLLDAKKQVGVFVVGVSVVGVSVGKCLGVLVVHGIATYNLCGLVS